MVHFVGQLEVDKAVLDFLTPKWFRRRLRSAALKDAGLPLFIFVVAHGRSGSTLLQNILASQGNVHLVGENNNVLHALLTAYERACEAKAVHGTESRMGTGDPWRGIHRIDVDRFGSELVRVFIQEIIQPPEGARAIGFKEIRYIDYPDVLPKHLRLMEKLFAPALIIFNRRKVKDSAISLSKWWTTMTFEDITAELSSFNRIVEQYASVNPQSTIIVDYDTYVKDSSHLEPLFARLGIPFDRALVEKIMMVRLSH